MAGALGLSDVSSEDIDSRTGEKSKLKTGNLKRSYNMPKACVQQKMKPKSKGGQGMTRAAAMKACYPKKAERKRTAKMMVQDAATGAAVGSQVGAYSGVGGYGKKATKKRAVAGAIGGALVGAYAGYKRAKKSKKKKK